jgi:hypothetical protein
LGAEIVTRSDKGWKRPFDDPIPMLRARQLVILEDTGKYITRLPKAEHETAEWQATMEALILVATLGGPTMFARIGVMRALNRHVERVFDSTRKDNPLGKRETCAQPMKPPGRLALKSPESQSHFAVVDAAAPILGSQTSASSRLTSTTDSGWGGIFRCARL